MDNVVDNSPLTARNACIDAGFNKMLISQAIFYLNKIKDLETRRKAGQFILIISSKQAGISGRDDGGRPIVSSHAKSGMALQVLQCNIFSTPL